MENQEKVATTQSNVQAPPQEAKIEVQVERFPVAKAKFSKEAWDSGEGGGEGEG
jgi:hypothetical protein